MGSTSRAMARRALLIVTALLNAHQCVAFVPQSSAVRNTIVLAAAKLPPPPPPPPKVEVDDVSKQIADASAAASKSLADASAAASEAIARATADAAQQPAAAQSLDAALKKVSADLDAAAKSVDAGAASRRRVGAGQGRRGLDAAKTAAKSIDAEAVVRSLKQAGDVAAKSVESTAKSAARCQGGGVEAGPVATRGRERDATRFTAFCVKFDKVYDTEAASASARDGSNAAEIAERNRATPPGSAKLRPAEPTPEDAACRNKSRASSGGRSFKVQQRAAVAPKPQFAAAAAAAAAVAAAPLPAMAVDAGDLILPWALTLLLTGAIAASSATTIGDGPANPKNK
ncbi:hypothetical protein JL721_12283 [Aureococcus anophagefferens]|nr:hypothetical protein JL721_12283 [Aureococcus anophagefferens]